MSDQKQKLRKRTIRSFITLFVVAILGFGAFTWTNSYVREGDEAPVFFRKALEWNGKIWHSYFSAKNLAHSPAPPPGKKPRLNGDIGLSSANANWSMEVQANAADPHSKILHLNMRDIRALPRTETTANFKCIEGWSEPISYAGVKFSDFLSHYKIDASLPYVGLETPDGEYYVSIDMKSMLHPQTILAYEMNGKALDEPNGAPLRLIIPVKYGIKNLKRIGKLFLSQKRPPDYWAEQGYDWFSGL